MDTRVVRVPPDTGARGRFDPPGTLERWVLGSDDGAALEPAAARLRAGSVPVAFPTETVYGLGADATRPDAVRGIYAAKGRPSDNPLIVHVCDLEMLRSLLPPPAEIPDVYRPLLARFWPGPLTVLLPSPGPSSLARLALAPEVTAGLPTFGARLPASPLARSLIRLAAVPIAAPSANASTRPSPTTAGHVLDDLRGRIELIVDGGPCGVGVESTVVDGLCDPPAVLRPGGVGIEDIRACGGAWARVVAAYEDAAETGTAKAPRAPGMKYRHYSPRARVVLYEAETGRGVHSGEAEGQGPGAAPVLAPELAPELGGGHRRVGIIRTRRWVEGGGIPFTPSGTEAVRDEQEQASFEVREGVMLLAGNGGTLWDIDLGGDPRAIARGLFAALRELDRRGADTILVEGIDGDGGDVAAAVMNRLRKAATEIRRRGELGPAADVSRGDGGPSG